MQQNFLVHIHTTFAEYIRTIPYSEWLVLNPGQNVINLDTVWHCVSCQRAVSGVFYLLKSGIKIMPV